MKTSIRTIILSAAVIFAAMSCQKEESVPGTQDRVNASETIQVNIDACLGDLVSADGTKATAEPVVRLTWDGSEKVQAYCGTDKIGTDLTVTPSENGLSAKLTGEITITSLTPNTSVITFVYSSGCQDNGLEFDFSTQTKTDGIPFVAYATLVYDGTATLTEKMVEFKFATSVMKIAATDLGGGEISAVAIKGINTKVTLTPSTDKASLNPGIAGSSESPAQNITTENFSSSSDGTRAIVTVGLVPDNTSNPYRMLTVSQTGYTNKGVITSDEIKSSTSYTTPAALFTCGTLGSGADAHDYVLIAGTKWATQNLAISKSGQKPWMSVEVPGTSTPVQIGDYFQWGAHTGTDYTTEENFDKGLLIYKEFTNNGSSGSFTWKKDGSSNDYQFSTSNISPYYDKTDSKYTEYDTKRSSVLAPSDDVARILWSDPWRMPTSAEFKALCDATYWKWDDTDKGYYVYAPKSGDAGKMNGSTSYDKSSALLFFPAAGRGFGTDLSGAGVTGYYWSSSLNTSSPNYAYRLTFFSDNVHPQSYDHRCYGFPVRPVSD